MPRPFFFHKGASESVVSIASQEVTEELCQTIHTQLESKKVKKLAFKNSTISSHSLLLVTRALAGSSVSNLQISGCSIDDAQLSILAAGLPATRIRRLSLKSNSITDLGASGLAGVLSDTSITYLDLSLNQVTESGTKELSDSSKKLKRLKVNNKLPSRRHKSGKDKPDKQEKPESDAESVSSHSDDGSTAHEQENTVEEPPQTSLRPAPVFVLTDWMAKLGVNEADAIVYSSNLVKDGYESTSSLEFIREDEWARYVNKVGHQRLLQTAIVREKNIPTLNWSLRGKYVTFLSHFKREAGDTARLMKGHLRAVFGHDVFLDSDHLVDLQHLSDNVQQADTLLMLQTKGFLSRPWCLLELHTAITKQIPIVGVNVLHKGYDFEESSDFLNHLDTKLDVEARRVLEGAGLDVLDVAYKLSVVIPFVVSKSFDPFASENVIDAQLSDIATTITQAQPPVLTMSREEWEQRRRV